MSPSDSTNLTRDANRDTYFASPELSQRADLLRHLTENSNLIPLVRGAEGMGKTTFIKHLLDLAPENWIPVEICADVMLQPDAMMADLADMFDQNDTSDHLMDDLIRHFDVLRQDGFLPVVVVDDAHLLPEASIIALLRLHERGHNGEPLVQILLFAEPDIDELLKTSQLRVMNLQSLQLLDMPEFTLDQTELYVEHLLSSADPSLAISPITASQLEKLHFESGGSPGLIKEQVQGLIDSAKKPAATTEPKVYFSIKNVFGVGVVVVVVMLILIYQKDINAIFSGDDEPTSATQEDQPKVEDSVYLPIPDFVDGADPAQEMIEDDDERVVTPGDAEVVAGGDQDLGPVFEEKAEVKGGLVAEPVDQVPQQEKSNTPSKPKPATMPQKVVSKSEEKTGALIQPPVENKVKQPTAELAREEGKGEGAKSEAEESKPLAKATAAKVKKPPQVKSPPQVKKPEMPVDAKKELSKPAAKSVQKSPAPTIKGPAKPTQISQAPVKKEGVSVPAPVEDRSTVLVQKEVPSVKINGVKAPAATTKRAVLPPKRSPGGLLREEWLLKQSPSSYTIQLVGLQDEKGIAEFIRRYSVSGHIAYYRTQRNGKPWFPVLFGAYSTRSRAVDARNKLPEKLVKSGVWLRTLGSVQRDIRAK